MSNQDPNAPRPRATTMTTTVVRPPSHRRGRFLRRFWLPAVLLLALAAGGLTGVVLAYQINYSEAANEVAALATYRPSVVTRVYADDGETVIGEFALERRIPLRFEEIPPNVKNAILAVEDVRFNDHVGIDPIRIAGAAWKNVTTGSREGGSTLTQQLAKNLFLTREQTLQRKFKEWIMALQIERFYTKQQIMEMYVNHIFLGANAYGFEAAAQTYFDKHAKDLTIDEAALLAGIPRSTSRYSPTVNPVEAKERRNLVLELMARNGFVSQAEADAAKARPIELADTAFYRTHQSSPVFQYPVEEIRKYLEEKYTTRVAQGGLTVYSTINVEAQKKAFEALRAGLRSYDRSHSGWRSDYRNIADEQNGATPTAQQLAEYKNADWFAAGFEKDTYVKGLVTKVDAARNEATVRFGSYTATVTAKDMGWSGRQPKSEFKPGDLPEFKVVEVNGDAHTLKVELSQVPAVQGAIMTVNAKNGEIVTMVGGYDPTINKFNNATQAYRQTGSAFKPFVYAAAVEWGLGPESTVSGAPIRRGSWQPHNYDGSLGHGDVPMKTALAKSLNVAAVHLLDMVGIQTGAQMVRRFGITVPMAPYLPSALGATEVPLDQMVSAYSAFANKGVRYQQHLVRRVLDRDGATLEEWETTTSEVMSEYVALTMVEMMQAVTSGGGTAPAASSVGHPVAGKTGTVNDHTDVWFIGYTPSYVTGVWMGYSERKKSLGRDMTGGRGALPIWIDFMKAFLKDKPKEKFEKAPEMPEDIKELYQQRMREMAEERERLYAGRAARGGASGDGRALPDVLSEPRLETITLPPAAGADAGSGTATTTTSSAPAAVQQPRPVVVTRDDGDDDAPPPPAAATRPREVEPQKKKGKKGSDDNNNP
ncbi:MAG TPA: PBP1A family penicillin-binding protein [Pyrinomonadaceae bacterium]|nr:PBP1A family penicillin-binding protein [Pyrinomonadaceae bacterium]